MRYWWVNQNQTFRQEFDGGYLWSPKRNRNDARNPFYEFMREVAPGDLIFSFVNTLISAISVARSSAYEAPKPPEFGDVGPNWSKIGWRVDARYYTLESRIRPADQMELLSGALGYRYAPLQKSGRGKQNVYLTRVSELLASHLFRLIGQEARDIRDMALRVRDDPLAPKNDVAVGLVQWEEHLLQEIERDQKIPATEREAIIIARRGQGAFKEAVLAHNHRCLITGVDRIEHLRASHIRPWRDCQNFQRLDGDNGFLLTPTVDHLFDRGFISFANNGRVLISPRAHHSSLEKMGVRTDGTARALDAFTEGQRDYLDFHRDKVFLKAQVQY